MSIEDILQSPPKYMDVVAAHGLDLAGGDLQINDKGNIAVTPDGDLKFGNDRVNALHRLVQRWCFNAPTLAVLFKLVVHANNAKQNLDAELDGIRNHKPAVGRAVSRHQQRNWCSYLQQGRVRGGNYGRTEQPFATVQGRLETGDRYMGEGLTATLSVFNSLPRFTVIHPNVDVDPASVSRERLAFNLRVRNIEVRQFALILQRGPMALARCSLQYLRVDSCDCFARTRQ